MTLPQPVCAVALQAQTVRCIMCGDDYLADLCMLAFEACEDCLHNELQDGYEGTLDKLLSARQ